MAYKTRRKSNSLNMPTGNFHFFYTYCIIVRAGKQEGTAGNLFLPAWKLALASGRPREEGLLGPLAGLGGEREREVCLEVEIQHEALSNCPEVQWISRLLPERKQANDRLVLNYMAFGSQPGMLSTPSFLFMASLQSWLQKHFLLGRWSPRICLPLISGHSSHPSFTSSLEHHFPQNLWGFSCSAVMGGGLEP